MLIHRTTLASSILPSLRLRAGQSVMAVMAMLLAACSTQTGGYNPETRFFGLLAADEPAAVNAARQILFKGGSAADAAVTLGLGLAVTLPSRASLGGGGICLMHAPGTSTVQSLEFMPRRVDPAQERMGGAVSGALGSGLQPQSSGPFLQRGASVAAAVPGLVRGLAGLQARFGKLHWAEVVAPAENLARFRARVSRSLAQDIAAYAAGAGFDGQDLVEGDEFNQVPLADTLAQIRVHGAAELYTGDTATAISNDTGIPAEALRRYTPDLEVPLKSSISDDTVYFPPTPGGRATQAAWTRLAEVRRLSSLPGPERAAAMLDVERSFLPPEIGAALTGRTAATGASTGFVVVDAAGGAVSCTLTMGRPFGTGRIIGDTGILAGAPDDSQGMLELSIAPMLAINEATTQFAEALAGSGSAAAATDTALVGRLTEQGDQHLADSLAAPRAFGVPGGPGVAEPPLTSPGLTPMPAQDRVDGAVCLGGLPRAPDSCDARSDPRGSGIGGIIDSPL